jgi:hypothetical protein
MPSRKTLLANPTTLADLAIPVSIVPSADPAPFTDRAEFMVVDTELLECERSVSDEP